jgi:hypothetical protein
LPSSQFELAFASDSDFHFKPSQFYGTIVAIQIEPVAMRCAIACINIHGDDGWSMVTISTRQDQENFDRFYDGFYSYRLIYELTP